MRQSALHMVAFAHVLIVARGPSLSLSVSAVIARYVLYVWPCLCGVREPAGGSASSARGALGLGHLRIGEWGPTGRLPGWI